MLPCFFISIGGIFSGESYLYRSNLQAFWFMWFFHSNVLPHSNTRVHFLSLNLTKTSITGTNNILNPSFTFLLPGQPYHGLSCFSIFFIVHVSGTWWFSFPTGSTVHFILAVIFKLKFLRRYIHIYLYMEVSPIILVAIGLESVLWKVIGMGEI